MSRPPRARRAPADPPPTLPPRQLACLRFLDGYRSDHAGRSPTHREIAAALGLRSATAATYLEPLRRKGVLRRAARGGHRNWRITALGDRILDAASRDAAAAAPGADLDPRSRPGLAT